MEHQEQATAEKIAALVHQKRDIKNSTILVAILDCFLYGNCPRSGTEMRRRFIGWQQLTNTLDVEIVADLRLPFWLYPGPDQCEWPAYRRLRRKRNQGLGTVCSEDR